MLLVIKGWSYGDREVDGGATLRARTSPTRRCCPLVVGVADADGAHASAGMTTERRGRSRSSGSPCRGIRSRMGAPSIVTSATVIRGGGAAWRGGCPSGRYGEMPGKEEGSVRAGCSFGFGFSVHWPDRSMR